jgi:hypothetical protein
MRRTISTFSALLALAFTACANPTPEVPEVDPLGVPITQEKNTNIDPKAAPLVDTIKDSIKTKSASIVLSTLKVEPTPGLVDAKEFRQRGANSSAQGAGYFGSLDESSIGRGGVASDGDLAPAKLMSPAEPAAPMLVAPKGIPSKKSEAPTGGSKGMIGGSDGFGSGEGHGRYEQPAASLKAGEINDNKNFEDYLSYLQKKAQLSGVAQIDVSERIQLSIVDGTGRPVHDAKVTLMVDGRPWLRAKSHTNGNLVFFPNAAGQLPQGKAMIRVEKDGVTFEKELASFTAKEAITLNGATASQGTARLDLVFCIDTTGSMGDEIAQIQSTVQEIITKTQALPAKPDLRVGMVLYGDRGDLYTTRVYDFTTDYTKFKSSVANIAMTGGGDIPEDVNSGLEDAIESLEWNNQESARMVFLIGDAAPHMDYGQKYDYKVAALRAAEQGIKIFPLASSGLEDVGEFVFRQVALFTEANFLFLTYGQGDTTSMNVDRDSYTPDKLDEVIVKLITDELKPLSK